MFQLPDDSRLRACGGAAPLGHLHVLLEQDHGAVGVVGDVAGADPLGDPAGQPGAGHAAGESEQSRFEPKEHQKVPTLVPDGLEGRDLAAPAGEAMACGLPCAATDAGDTGVLLGDTGILVKRQSPEHLCRAWGTIARMDPADRTAMGMKARERIMRHYTQEMTTESYQQEYLKIVTPARSSAS